ncbi:Zn-dependent protease [Inhella inkyongensis]|uniref:Zn-dependent protease n=1 Tax=Inhella inkyongensis TaxID=392593 RepID=A0A840SD10_9BURK|nr:hypothetical protein [Inhella inkyongensis]MBB5206230.1 Zn-dependent protease [Inhella inkyongensis]
MTDGLSPALRAGPPPRVDQTQRRAWRRQLPGVLGGGLVGALFAFWEPAVLGRALERVAWAEFGLWDWVLVVLLALPTLQAPLWLHEIGHLVAGRLAGFKARAMLVGRWQLDFGPLRLSRSRVPHPGGLALMSPHPEYTRRRDWALYLSGGVVINLLSAGLALGLAAQWRGWTLLLVLGFAAVSLVLGLVNLLPLRVQGFVTDGGHLLGLLRGSGDSEARLLCAALSAQGAGGSRYADWDPALLARAAQRAESADVRAMVSLLRAIHAEDRNEPEQAMRHYGELADLLVSSQLSCVPVSLQGHYLLPVAGFLASQGEVQAAQRWLEGAGSLMLDPYLRDFTRLRLGWAQGQAEPELRAQVEAALEHAVDQAGAQFARTLLLTHAPQPVPADVIA